MMKIFLNPSLSDTSEFIAKWAIANSQACLYYKQESMDLSKEVFCA